MCNPIRIQRKRSKGYKTPPNTLYVGRPTKFGNPFLLQGDMIYVDAGHRRKILSKWVCFYQDGGHTIEEVVKLYRDMLLDLNSHEVEPEIKQRFKVMQDSITDLTGKNLSCFCSLSCRCINRIVKQIKIKQYE